MFFQLKLLKDITILDEKITPYGQLFNMDYRRKEQW